MTKVSMKQLILVNLIIIIQSKNTFSETFTFVIGIFMIY